ncbi:hypothetical protein T12_7336 [Trichinella patagoniensis]|uniref:Uncharacterized protein n=1 Tax=Trichinella patagoniensis TaxID=990121 RepID=A0A0V1AD83_9BILA|nr:hypothetical protein T12_7336 [Trichinella patagoniensis]
MNSFSIVYWFTVLSKRSWVGCKQIEAFPCPWARWEMKDAQFRLASSLGSVQLASRQIVNLRVRTHS